MCARRTQSPQHRWERGGVTIGEARSVGEHPAAEEVAPRHVSMRLTYVTAQCCSSSIMSLGSPPSGLAVRRVRQLFVRSTQVFGLAGSAVGSSDGSLLLLGVRERIGQTPTCTISRRRCAGTFKRAIRFAHPWRVDTPLSQLLENTRRHSGDLDAVDATRSVRFCHEGEDTRRGQRSR